MTRVCYIIQLALAGEVDEAEARRQASSGIEQLGLVFDDHESAGRLHRARADIEAGRFYPALRAVRSLLPAEGHLMALAGRA